MRSKEVKQLLTVSPPLAGRRGTQMQFKRKKKLALVHFPLYHAISQKMWMLEILGRPYVHFPCRS